MAIWLHILRSFLPEAREESPCNDTGVHIRGGFEEFISRNEGPRSNQIDNLPTKQAGRTSRFEYRI